MIISENYWFLDVEASSLNKNSYPIEIGFVNASNNRSYSSFINPDTVDGWDDWSTDSEEIHNICRFFLWEHGRSALTVAKEIRELLDNATVIVDSPVFDRMWIFELFAKSNMNVNFEIISVEEFLYDHGVHGKIKDFNKESKTA